MIELIGIVAMICLMIAGIPQALKSIHDGHSKGIDGKYLILLLCGFTLMSLYIILTKPLWPVLVNYGANIITMLIVCYYKIYPRQENDKSKTNK